MQHQQIYAHLFYLYLLHMMQNLDLLNKECEMGTVEIYRGYTASVSFLLETFLSHLSSRRSAYGSLPGEGRELIGGGYKTRSRNIKYMWKQL